MKKILLLMALVSFTFMNAQVISSVDFEDGTFGTWSLIQTNTTETFAVADVTAGNGNTTLKAAQIIYDANLALQDERIVSPSMDFSSATSDVNIQFQYMMSYYWGVDPNNNYDVNLLVSTDGGANWTEIWDETNDPNFTSTEDYIWRTISVSLGSYVGESDVKLAFQYLGTDGAQAGIDEIVVTNDPYVVPSAPSPVTLLIPADTATDVVIDTADNDADGSPDMGVAFDWDPATTGDAATGYDVYLGDSAATMTLLGTTSNDQVTITGMQYSTTYFWSIVAKNAGGEAVGSSTWSFTTEADPAASIKDNELASQVSIYPTSTKDNFTINNKSNTALTSVSLFDINGRVVLNQNLENLIGEKSINVSNLSTGMYFVQLNTANATVTKKLIKK